jgi:D-serine deaminase-like pyridoxal phosphate-dependent protein
MEWYQVNDTDKIDTPALLVFPDRVRQNMIVAKKLVPHDASLRPHVKTHKLKEVAQMMLKEGISKFKCATIAEAEMLVMSGATDILLAYQPVKPKAGRLAALAEAFPDIHFSCLIDNVASAQLLSDIFENQLLSVYIDLNVGMNRTGVSPEDAPALYEDCKSIENISIAGLHAYDGHINDTDLELRKKRADEVYQRAAKAKEKIKEVNGKSLKLILGGTATFPLHAQHQNVEVSPGTFIFWDEGYGQVMPELAFNFAAVTMTRIISVIDKENLCLDLGYKSIAAENPLPRVKFLNVEDAVPVGQSEEHLVVKVPDATAYKVGDVWYGVPYHICPTVALYDTVHVIERGEPIEKWKVMARDRSITF